jgi:DNA polymerase III alpha subunit
MLEYSMIPLFKSTYSIGKSILTLAEPSKTKDGGPDSIISIAIENKLDKIFLIEDSMIGFIDAHKRCQENGIQLIFGLRINCCNDRTNEESRKESGHKIVVMAKNDEGVSKLTRIYSLANQESGGYCDCEMLKNLWDDNYIKLCIPFYDSFIYMNNFIGSKCVPDFKFTKPTMFVEDNDLPFDELITEKIVKYAQQNNLKMEQAKSIYYKKRSDFEAWQTYKCLCNRSFGKQQSLSNPNLSHCGSDSFSWEAFEEYER